MRYHYQTVIGAGLTTITAHAGCENTQPNSIENIRAALASGAEIMEVDVRRIGGELCLTHDEQTGDCVPLRTLFEMTAPEENISLNLDLKTDDLTEEILPLVKEFHMEDRVLLTGECQNDIDPAHNRLCVWRNLWDGETIEDAISDCIAKNIPAFNVNYRFITEAYNEQLKANGSGISAWTVDNEDDIRRLLKMGVKNITTRHPCLALQLRSEIQPSDLATETFLNIVRQAGNMMLERPDTVTQKDGSANFVTERDTAIESFLKKKLLTLYPDAGFLGEENGGEIKERMFIVDPIDGTTNYIHDLHASVVSVAFSEKGEITFGAVYNPYAQEMFFAQRGKGAYLNGKPVHVSTRKGEQAVVGVGSSPYNKKQTGERTMHIMKRVFDAAGDFRRTGAAALEICLVACGRLEAYYEMTLNPWDFAAATLVLTEAGGCASKMNGEKLPMNAKTDVLAANKEMYETMLNACKDA